MLVSFVGTVPEVQAGVQRLRAARSLEALDAALRNAPHGAWIVELLDLPPGADLSLLNEWLVKESPGTVHALLASGGVPAGAVAWAFERACLDRVEITRRRGTRQLGVSPGLRSPEFLCTLLATYAPRRGSPCWDVIRDAVRDGAADPAAPNRPPVPPARRGGRAAAEVAHPVPVSPWLSVAFHAHARLSRAGTGLFSPFDLTTFFGRAHRIETLRLILDIPQLSPAITRAAWSHVPENDRVAILDDLHSSDGPLSSALRSVLLESPRSLDAALLGVLMPDAPDAAAAVVRRWLESSRALLEVVELLDVLREEDEEHRDTPRPPTVRPAVVDALLGHVGAALVAGHRSDVAHCMRDLLRELTPAQREVLAADATLLAAFRHHRLRLPPELAQFLPPPPRRERGARQAQGDAPEARGRGARAKRGAGGRAANAPAARNGGRAAARQRRG